MKLLITGATGFVGRNLLLKAIADKRYSQIYVPVRSLEKFKKQCAQDGLEKLPENVIPVVTSAPNWDFGGVTQFDHVIHSAGLIFARTQKEYFETNVDGTVELFRKIQRPKSAVILSSQSAAGPCSRRRAFKHEEDLDRPLTWYGKSKLEMERRLRHEFSDLNYVCLRPPMIFGARDQATLPLFKLARNPFLFKPGFKSKQYSFISVNDLVNAVFLALFTPTNWDGLRGRHFFVASNAPITDRTLLKSAAQVSQKRGMIVTVPQPLLWGVSRVIDTVPTWRATIPSLSVDRAREIWPDKWVVSSKAFQEKFGWQPQDEFLTTLEETRNWYLKVGQLNA